MSVPRTAPETTMCNPRLSGHNGVAQTVARTIIFWRGQLGMTQTKLAELSGVSRKRVNEIEAGCKSEIHGSTLFRLALALLQTPNVLYGYAPPDYTPHPPLTPAAARVLHGGL